MEEENLRTYGYSSYNRELIDYLYKFIDTYGFGYRTKSGSRMSVGSKAIDIQKERIKYFHTTEKYFVADIMDKDEGEYFYSAIKTYINSFEVGDFVYVSDGYLLKHFPYKEYKIKKGKMYFIKQKYCKNTMTCQYLLNDGNMYSGIDLINKYSCQHDLKLQKYMDMIEKYVKEKNEKESLQRKIGKVTTKVNEIVDILEEE